MIAGVALDALRIMHFDIEARASLPADASGLADAPGTACVAACYKCLMSYYNQPDHELIDRRDAQAKAILLRLARASVSGLELARSTPPPAPAGAEDTPESRWRARAAALGLPAPDPAPLAEGGVSLPLVWRGHYVVAALGALGAAAVGRLEDRGFAVIPFDADEATWAEPFRQLAGALGR
jgi:hypothetical protein